MTAIAPRWRKSTRSQQVSNCVEVHADLDAVRDSKNASGPVLSGPVRALVFAIRDGRIG